MLCDVAEGLSSSAEATVLAQKDTLVSDLGLEREAQRAWIVRQSGDY